jgi:VWFA-related protein
MSSTFRRIAVALIVFGAACFSPVAAQSPSEQSQQTFRASADVVTIQASVRDGRGKMLGGLVAADFEIRDNGELRQILSLRSDRQSPLSLALLVDMSGSMRISGKVAMARQAYASLVAQLRQENDEAAVFTFDSALHERQPFTSDPLKLKKALDDFEPFGFTSLYDATAAAASRLATRTAAHKAIVVLTDGLDTSSMMTAAQVSALASSIDVPVFIVATMPSVDARFMMERSERPRAKAADLRDLAEWTGGKFVFASTLGETVVAAATLVDELREQYLLAIEAATVSEWRRLDVRVKRPSAKVKARSGYFGG